MASPLWEYFKDDQGKRICQVRNCKTQYGLGTSKTILKKHLLNIHNIKLPVHKKETAEITSKPHQPSIISSMKQGPCPKEVKLNADHTLLLWLSGRGLPLSYVRDGKFKEFCQSLRANYIPPCVLTLKNMQDKLVISMIKVSQIYFISKSNMNKEFEILYVFLCFCRLFNSRWLDLSTKHQLFRDHFALY